MAPYEEFMKSLSDEEEVEYFDDSSESDEDALEVKKKNKELKKLPKNVSRLKRAEEFDETFLFDDNDDDLCNWKQDHLQPKNKVEITTLDEKIAKVRHQQKKQVNSDDEIEKGDEDVEETHESDDDGEEEMVFADKQDKVREKKKKKKKKTNDGKIQYSQEIDTYDSTLSFQDMNLSRPLLKALSAMSFSAPTPIQIATIPVALMGKDICACAATGTGKTAAFMLPVIERLLYKPKSAPVTRVLVVTPTRELAVQIYQVSRKLAQNTNIDVSLSAGGLDIKSQEAALRLGPDIVIATPGRLIDQVHNAPNFTLDSVEVLVLDEADRMLDEYFKEQMKEIMKLCSKTHQTMLFSATMTEEVEEVAALSLKAPVRIFVNENTEVALNLRQEFIRIRNNREGDREAVIAALLTRSFHSHVILFIQTKVQAHRMHIMLGLCGIKVAELHGNLAQAQRMEALKKFKEGEVDVLIATDLVSRGLDIEGVKTVINFTMPNSLKHYIHRVGRTARAGKAGRSITLVGEKERKLLKEIVTKAKNPVKSRIIPHDVIEKFRSKIGKFEKSITSIDYMEKEEKLIRVSEIQAQRAENLLENNEDEMNRPKRTWFQSHKEREQEKASLRLEEPMKISQKTGKNKRKALSSDDKVEIEIKKSQEYAKRFVKKETKLKRIHSCVDKAKEGQPPNKKMKKNKAKSSFEKELTSTSAKAVRMMRAGPSFEERKRLGINKHQGKSSNFKKGNKNDKRDGRKPAPSSNKREGRKPAPSSNKREGRKPAPKFRKSDSKGKKR